MRLMPAAPEFLVVSLWIVFGVNQAITIVDLYFQRPQHPESQKSRHLGADGIANTRRVKRDEILNLCFR
jgi:hypothetical protein